MQITENELLDRMPKSYDELNHKKYFHIMTTLPADKPEHWDNEEWNRYITFSILSIILEIPIIELERLKAWQLVPLIDRTQFFNKLPTGSKNTLKIKSMYDWNYDDFVNYNKLREDTFSNIDQILEIMVLDKTPEQIANFSVSEAYEVFFYLKRTTAKFAIRSFLFSAKKLMKEAIQMMKTAKAKRKASNKK